MKSDTLDKVQRSGIAPEASEKSNLVGENNSVVLKLCLKFQKFYDPSTAAALLV